MVWLLYGDKSFRIWLLAFKQCANVTDGQTDTARRHRPRLCIASRGKIRHFKQCTECEGEGLMRRITPVVALYVNLSELLQLSRQCIQWLRSLCGAQPHDSCYKLVTAYNYGRLLFSRLSQRWSTPAVVLRRSVSSCRDTWWRRQLSRWTCDLVDTRGPDMTARMCWYGDPTVWSVNLAVASRL